MPIASLACAIWALSLPAAAFDLQGHRGARGLAPENTLAGFRTALDLGVTTLETDLAVTKDEVVVISHDPLLNPDLTRLDGQWIAAAGPVIRTLTLADLKRYDIGRLNPASKYAQQFPEQKPVDGERFPTIEEFFAMAGPDVRFNIEIKTNPNKPDLTLDPERFAELAVAAIRKGKAGGAQHHPVVRLARPARGAPAGARDRHRAAFDREQQLRHGRPGQPPSRRRGSAGSTSRPMAARCRSSPRRRAAPCGRRSGATSRPRM